MKITKFHFEVLQPSFYIVYINFLGLLGEITKVDNTPLDKELTTTSLEWNVNLNITLIQFVFKFHFIITIAILFFDLYFFYFHINVSRLWYKAYLGYIVSFKAPTFGLVVVVKVFPSREVTISKSCSITL